MKRRQFITLLGGAAVWPVRVGAQQAARVRRVGAMIGLGGEQSEGAQARLAAFQDGLQKLGWADGHNVRIDHRWAGDADRVQVAADLVATKPDVILAGSNTILAALQRVTKTIPIVFAQVPDPVAAGFVSNMARPGANITGFANYEQAIAGKWLELLEEIAPSVVNVAVIFDPTNPAGFGYVSTMKTASSPFALQISAATVHDTEEIGQVVDAIAREPYPGLIILPSPAVTAHLDILLALAARYRLPTVTPFRDIVVAGALASYGVDNVDLFRRAASYVDRILKGEKPGDLPVQLATKYELAINLKTARALGLTVPESLLLRADEVIE